MRCPWGHYCNLQAEESVTAQAVRAVHEVGQGGRLCLRRPSLARPAVLLI